MYIDPQAPLSAVLPRGQQLSPLGTLGIANHTRSIPPGRDQGEHLRELSEHKPVSGHEEGGLVAAQGLAPRRGRRAALAILLLAVPYATRHTTCGVLSRHARHAGAATGAYHLGRHAQPEGWARRLHALRPAGVNLAGGSALGSPTKPKQRARKCVR
jgi:hypothetical protein